MSGYTTRASTIAVCIALALACTGGETEQAETHDDHEAPPGVVTFSAEALETAGISVAPVEAQALAPTVRVTGTLSYDERRMAVATARIGGRVSRVLADYGEPVIAGQVLAWIDSPELGAAQADYRRALALTRLRDAEHERARLLFEGGAISQAELLRREADRRAAQAELGMAEQKLNILGLAQTEVAALAVEEEGGEQVYPVRAPIAGRITEREAVTGRVVSPDEELFTVAELGTLWLFLDVFEKDVPWVSEGAIVSLTCESHPEERFHGAIDFVGQVLDPHSRTIRARAVIDNPAGELKPGMFVYADIAGEPDGGDVPPSLAVPAAAVTWLEGRDVVFVRSAERSFEVRPVTLGETYGDRVEILQGLERGEPIAVSGVFALKSELLAGGLEEHHH